MATHAKFPSPRKWWVFKVGWNHQLGETMKRTDVEMGFVQHFQYCGSGAPQPFFSEKRNSSLSEEKSPFLELGGFLIKYILIS